MLNTFDIEVLSKAPKTFTSETQDVVRNLLHTLFEVSHVARNEGLLSLEEYGQKLSKEDPLQRFIKDGILLIVDGTDPELVTDLLSIDIVFTGIGTLDGFLRYIAMKGLLMVQAGENPYTIERVLVRLIPITLYDEIYKKFREEVEQKEENDRKNALERIERECPLETTNPFIGAFADRIMELNDLQVQRVLREVDNMELATVLLFVPVETRKHIFNNMSERLQGMIAEDMITYPFQELAITSYMEKICNIIQKLRDMGDL